MYTIQYPFEYSVKHGASLIIHCVMEVLLKLEENQDIFLKNGHKISVLSPRYVHHCTLFVYCLQEYISNEDSLLLSIYMHFVLFSSVCMSGHCTFCQMHPGVLFRIFLSFVFTTI
jgi:hypothetical protein